MKRDWLQCYEIWKTENELLATIWVDDQATADTIAAKLGGTAHYQMSGIVVPDESYIK